MQAGRRVAEARDRGRVRVSRPELAGAARRHRTGVTGRRRPAAVADRRGAGRSGARRRTASRDHADRSSRQLVSDSLLVERREVRVRVGQHRSGRDRALGRARPIRAARHRRVREGDRAQRPREERTAVVPVRRADGGDQLPRSGAAVRDRSSTRVGRLPERVLRVVAALARGAHHRLPRRAAAAWARGTIAAATCMPALRDADRRFVDSFESDTFKGFAKLHGLELDLGDAAAGRAGAAADAWLHRLLHRDVDVRGASGQGVGDRAVRRGAARRRIVGARRGRHRLSRRTAANDGRRSHRQAAVRARGAFASGRT